MAIEIAWSRWFRLATPALLTLTAVANVLDAISTVIGESMGGREINPASVAIMSVVGLGGWAIFKFVLSLTMIAILASGRNNWRTMNVFLYVGMLLMSSVFFYDFAGAVSSNFGQIFEVLGL